MNELLAEIYGTNQQAEESDIEKNAAAELLVKLAEDEGVSLDDFSDQEIAEMINELQSGGADSEKTAGVGTEEEKEEEEEEEGASQEKVAEADFLGRVMAHSMTQELASIEKEAGSKMEAVKGGIGKALKAVKEYHIKGGKTLAEAKRGFTPGAPKGKGEFVGGRWGQKWSAKKRVGHAAKGAARFLPHAAAVGGVGAMAGKKKESSALDNLAEQRAMQMLEEAGYDTQEKQASALDNAVEYRALEMLEQAGYPVEWNQ